MVDFRRFGSKETSKTDFSRENAETNLFFPNLQSDVALLLRPGPFVGGAEPQANPALPARPGCGVPIRRLSCRASPGLARHSVRVYRAARLRPPAAELCEAWALTPGRTSESLVRCSRRGVSGCAGGGRTRAALSVEQGGRGPAPAPAPRPRETGGGQSGRGGGGTGAGAPRLPLPPRCVRPAQRASGEGSQGARARASGVQGASNCVTAADAARVAGPAALSGPRPPPPPGLSLSPSPYSRALSASVALWAPPAFARTRGGGRSPSASASSSPSSTSSATSTLFAVSPARTRPAWPREGRGREEGGEGVWVKASSAGTAASSSPPSSSSAAAPQPS